MDAIEARRQTAIGAERAREDADAKRAKAQQEENDALTNLESHIYVTAMIQGDRVYEAIRTATMAGASNARHTYSERISSSTRSSEYVEFIKAVTGEIATRVATGLTENGYIVELTFGDVVDYRDAPTAPPEYYDSYFEVSW